VIGLVARRGQTTIEFMLLLSVVVLLILAAVTTVNDITKVQQNATEAVRSGVENASLALLQQFSEQRVGLQLTNITEVDPNLVRLEVSKSDTYFANQPSVIQVVLWNDYAGVMQVPEVRAMIEGPQGEEVAVSPSSEFNVTVTLARSITTTFIPPQVGEYNITVTAYNDQGQILRQKKVAFSVVGGGVGGATFALERRIVAPRNSHFVEELQLPNATIRSATLELYDMHTYVYSNVTGYAYDWVFKKSITITGTSTAAALTSFHDTNSPLEVYVPEEAFITSAELDIANARVWLGGEELITTPTETELMRIVHPGVNVLNVQTSATTGGCTGGTSCNLESLGEATLRISYYAPDTHTATADQTMYSIKANDQNITLGTAMDLSPYLGPGANTINFTYLNGTFTYRLRVVTG